MIMKTLLALILVLAIPFHAHASEARELDLDLTVQDIIDDHAEINNAESPCLDEYRKWRNRAATASGLSPFVGLVGMTGGAILGLSWEYGGQQIIKPIIGSVLGSVVDVTVHFVIPGAIIGAMLTYKAIKVSHFVKASKAYRLVKGLYSNEGSSPLNQLTKRIQRQRPEITLEEIQFALLEADQSGALCDGSMIYKKKVLSGKKAKPLATLKDMELHLLKTL
jgi:hypothetical protein